MASRLSALAIVLSLGCLAGVSRACAEDLAATNAATAGTSAAATRDRLYAELAADVAELEQRGSILKRVVKLVTPAVVHIEAKRETEAARTARGESEEAGSGVIIERSGKFYVLTSRHVIKYSTVSG